MVDLVKVTQTGEKNGEGARQNLTVKGWQK